jgi:Rrf2 family nitric oxide-sensitive transcriptional repressor
VHLSLHTDYSLRVLLYLAEHNDRPVSTQEISAHYAISRHHLVRVVQTLNEHGFLYVTAGRNGGAMLARPAAQINLGQVVRKAEPSFRIVECFDLDKNTCPIVPACKLKRVLKEALDSFFHALDGYTLADLTKGGKSKRISQLVQISSAGLNR